MPAHPRSSAHRRLVVAALSDLLLATRIREVGKQAGVPVEVVSPAQVLEACRAKAPDLLILDLEAFADLAPLLSALRADRRTRALEVLGFYPHVRHELRRAALAAGLARALPRSVFSSRLAELLAGEARTSARPGLLDSPLMPPSDRLEGPVSGARGTPAAEAGFERVRISCPGCGRNDYVRWPTGHEVYHWKCFNCSKEFDLTREGGR